MHMPHRNRLKIAQVEVIDPRRQSGNVMRKAPLSIRIKQMFPVAKWRKVSMLKVTHRTEGLVFVKKEAGKDKVWGGGKELPTEIKWIPSESDISEEKLDKALVFDPLAQSRTENGRIVQNMENLL
eukprot:CAMPEP_0197531714 /NCGR_PEP_ID=MMETSP1318-20131121/36801_1 /TAXON_ID=552666 /ORGANISM="Partenskyella glossopodia, Strain RCC365" /LENGTH=124 /DNA_ID=CAMNT_0043088023 /DNA_START=57 /DNA_END=429 /DNA_ORIENTATION=+